MPTAFCFMLAFLGNIKTERAEYFLCKRPPLLHPPTPPPPYQLAKKGLLPLRLVDFPNEMASYQSEKEKQQGKPKPRSFTTSDVHLLESDGATWRFRHRLVQEWFAKKWEE